MMNYMIVGATEEASTLTVAHQQTCPNLITGYSFLLVHTIHTEESIEPLVMSPFYRKKKKKKEKK